MASKWTAIVALLALVAMAGAFSVANSLAVPEAVASSMRVSSAKVSCHRNMMQSMNTDLKLTGPEASANLKGLGCRMMSEYARDHFTIKQVAQFKDNCPRLDQLDPRYIQLRLNQLICERAELDMIKFVVRANTTEGNEARARANSHEIIKRIRPCMDQDFPAGFGNLEPKNCKRLIEIAEAHLTVTEFDIFVERCEKIRFKWDELLTFSAETGAKSVIKLAMELEPDSGREDVETWGIFSRAFYPQGRE